MILCILIFKFVEKRRDESDVTHSDVQVSPLCKSQLSFRAFLETGNHLDICTWPFLECHSVALWSSCTDGYEYVKYRHEY
jgi:hypothetical protein